MSCRYEYPASSCRRGDGGGVLRRLTYEVALSAGPGCAGGRAYRHRARARAHYRAALEPYFLTVQDIVAYARRQGILCQGRGSAANSRVCLLPGRDLGGPAAGTALLFERFISRERNEPPTSTSISRRAARGGACSMSTASTVVNAPRSPPRSSHTARAARLRDLARAFRSGRRRERRLAKSCNGGIGSARSATRAATSIGSLGTAAAAGERAGELPGLSSPPVPARRRAS